MIFAIVLSFFSTTEYTDTVVTLCPLWSIRKI